ncbi:MAG: HAD family phosphatase [Clostridia bacterium]|nr:HAD family phosphatase [Clostridia bacterium]
MTKQYIFDLGNVLARFDPYALTAACIKDEQIVQPVCDTVFDRPYWDLLDNGTLSDREFKMILRHRLPKEWQEMGCRVFDEWVQNMPPIAGMEQLVADLKASGVGLYLISNISIGFSETYHQIPWLNDLLSLFDGLVFSGPLQTVKPHAEIFEYLLHTYQLDPKECLFIDDSPLNINGAAAVGIPGYLFDGDAKKLRTFLKKT